MNPKKTTQNIAQIQAAFFYGYCSSAAFFGFFADQVGPRIIIAFAVGGSGVLNLCLGILNSNLKSELNQFLTCLSGWKFSFRLAGTLPVLSKVYLWDIFLLFFQLKGFQNLEFNS